VTIADIQPQTSSRSTRGRCPVYGFTLNGEPLDVLAQSASVKLTEGQHDQATITVSSPTLTTTENLTDMPISFRWGANPRIETFNGYVMDVKEETAQGSNVSLTFTMSILGATKAMFDGRPHFWSNKSIPSAVKDLVSQNQLGYSGHTHSYLWNALGQTSESDWAFVNKLADRIGWMITNRYGVVLLHDPVKLFTESGIFTRIAMGGSAGVNLQADRVLLDFQPMEEADALYTNLGYEFGYFTSSGVAQIARQPGLFRGYTFNAEVVIADQDAAQVYADSGNIDMDRWKQYAVARIWGDSDIYPGMCVEAITTNKQYLRTKYDGKWLVRSVSHSLDRQQFQTLLGLARPSGKAQVTTPAYMPFWQEPTATLSSDVIIGSGSVGRSKPTLYLDRTITLSGNPVTDTTASPQWLSTWSERRGLIST
jgi:hypothetical protein